jgi:hypothetical protein
MATLGASIAEDLDPIENGGADQFAPFPWDFLKSRTAVNYRYRQTSDYAFSPTANSADLKGTPDPPSPL